MTTRWIETHKSVVLVVAMGLPLLWCALAAHLRGNITAAAAALVLVLLVVGAGSTGDRLAGVVAAASGGLWFDYFLTAPFNRFRIKNASDVEVTVSLVLVGLAVTELTLWGRREQAKASARAGYLDGVLKTSQIVSGQFSTAALIDQVAVHITELLDVDACRFVEGITIPPKSAILGPDGDVAARGAALNVERDGLPSMEETVLPTQHHGITYGWFLITAATQIARPTLEQRRVAVLLANQVGASYATAPH